VDSTSGRLTICGCHRATNCGQAAQMPLQLVIRPSTHRPNTAQTQPEAVSCDDSASGKPGTLLTSRKLRGQCKWGVELHDWLRAGRDKNSTSLGNKTQHLLGQNSRSGKLTRSKVHILISNRANSGFQRATSNCRNKHEFSIIIITTTFTRSQHVLYSAVSLWRQCGALRKME
jgi:hypothetical protein